MGFWCVKQNALQGEINKVYIKRVDVANTLASGGIIVEQYIDTTNRMWFLEELIDFETAKILALAYWESRIPPN